MATGAAVALMDVDKEESAAPVVGRRVLEGEKRLFLLFSAKGLVLITMQQREARIGEQFFRLNRGDIGHR